MTDMPSIGELLGPWRWKDTCETAELLDEDPRGPVVIRDLRGVVQAVMSLEVYETLRERGQTVQEAAE